MKTSVHHKEFEKVIRSIARRCHLWQVFSDFCEMAALSLANAFYQRDDIEQRYMETVKRYNQDEASEFAHLLAIVVQALDDEMQDFLGEMFMQLELGSHWHGQFFTPYDLCHMMAGLNISDATVERLKGGGFVTLSEPACGAGAMVIAFAEALRARGINYQQAMHVTAADVDSTASDMTYIQLALLHVPGYVITGNTLTLETRRTLATPAHLLGMWDYKLLRDGESLGESPLVVNGRAPEQMPTERQIKLFDDVA